LAEDDPDDEELFRLAIEQANIECRIDTVRTGEELLDYLFGSGAHRDRDVSVSPDLLLLDLKMPKLNGLQVLTILQRALRGTRNGLPPIVVFTSSDDQQDVAAAYKLGALSFLRKPVNHGRFIETVQQAVLYWLSLNEPVPTRLGRAATTGGEKGSFTR